MDAILDAAQALFKDITDLNMEAVIDRYAHDDNLYVHLEGPRWTNRGFENVARGWRAFFASPLRMQQIEWIEGPLTQQSGTLGYIAGVVQIHYRVNEREGMLKLRGTFVMRQDADGKWRVLHEHFSQPLDDPYGFGDWLKAE
jgi:ketosteroid isomerase-like protein